MWLLQQAFLQGYVRQLAIYIYNLYGSVRKENSAKPSAEKVHARRANKNSNFQKKQSHRKHNNQQTKSKQRANNQQQTKTIQSSPTRRTHSSRRNKYIKHKKVSADSIYTGVL